MSLPPIVTLTLNPAIDAACEAEVVRPIHKIRTTNEEFCPGGGGINVARTVRDLGGDALALYLAGGATGRVLDELAAAIGLSCRPIAIGGHTRISHVVYERSSGLEYRFVPEGPFVTEDEWRTCLAEVAGITCDYFVASGSLPRGLPADAYAQVADRLPRDTKFVLDTSGAALAHALDRGGLFLDQAESRRIRNARRAPSAAGRGDRRGGDGFRAVGGGAICGRHARARRRAAGLGRWRPSPCRSAMSWRKVRLAPATVSSPLWCSRSPAAGLLPMPSPMRSRRAPRPSCGMGPTSASAKTSPAYTRRYAPALWKRHFPERTAERLS